MTGESRSPQIQLHGDLALLLNHGMRISGFKQACSIKDYIESFGIPHTEIGLLLVNQNPVDFSYTLQGDEYIDVYPPGEIADSISTSGLAPAKPVPFRLIADTHLGKLARYCRMLGFDTLYQNDYDDPTLAYLSQTEQRILLTRDKKLLMRNQVSHGYYLRSQFADEQLGELLQRYALFKQLKPFSRCIACNGELKETNKAIILPRLQENTARYFNDFWVCNSCGQIYWKGSHYQQMQNFINKLLNRINN